MSTGIGINGFGGVGRLALRAARGHRMVELAQGVGASR